ncbi:HEAT repeat domain-containing protein [Euhalothece natronophila]|nr:HEAT repeat domain-containing protein [Euhalothece natronophila]
MVERKVDFLPKPSFINFDQEKELKQARRRSGRGGGIIIDIRDEDGEITTWGFWLINILSPVFVIGELIKVVISFIVLPFNSSLANSFFQGAISNIIAMSPGLIFYALVGVLGSLVDSNEEEKETHNKAVSDPNTSPKNLQKLARDEDWRVRREVASNASNPNTPPKILQKLARDEDWRVREKVASNPNTPPEILQQLAQDKDERVRSKAYSNPNLSL